MGPCRCRDPVSQQLVGVLHAETGPESYVNQVAFSRDSTLLASADGDGTVRLRTPATRQAFRRIFPG